MRKITEESIKKFKNHLVEEEKSTATVNKYMRDVCELHEAFSDRELDKGALLLYKTELCKKYAPRSVNTKISAINSFFDFQDWYELKIKTLKIQRQIFAPNDIELTKEDYQNLLAAAKKNARMHLLLQTICSSGIRVSELSYITVEAATLGRADIACKGKRRTVFLPERLCTALCLYAEKKNIKSGAIFITRCGNPIDRSNVWSDMKRLCKVAGVSKNKVFPHNLRHLFARSYYSREKDIVRLADILGHTSVNTTRIYTMESGEVHRKQISKLGLLDL